MNVAMDFWNKSTIYNIPEIAIFARYCFCIAVSSAAAERVFSVVKSSLSLVQLNKCLEEYSELMIMIQYNSRDNSTSVQWEEPMEIE